MNPMKAAWPTKATANQRTAAQRRAVAPASRGNGDVDAIDMTSPDAASGPRSSAGMAATGTSGLADLEFGERYFPGDARSGGQGPTRRGNFAGRRSHATGDDIQRFDRGRWERPSALVAARPDPGSCRDRDGVVRLLHSGPALA